MSNSCLTKTKVGDILVMKNTDNFEGDYEDVVVNHTYDGFPIVIIDGDEHSIYPNAGYYKIIKKKSP